MASSTRSENFMAGVLAGLDRLRQQGKAAYKQRPDGRGGYRQLWKIEDAEHGPLIMEVGEGVLTRRTLQDWRGETN